MGARVAAAAAAMLLAASCDPAGIEDRMLGVSRAPSGEVVIHLALCPGEAVEWLELEEPGRRDSGPDRPDRVLWRIVADPPAAFSTVRVGRLPTGFRTDVAWDPRRRDLRRPFIVAMETTGHGWAGNVWDEAEVPADGIIASVGVDDEVFTEEGFERNAARAC